MEPTQRKMKILEAVVELYIRTGEPVGSKNLCDVLEFNVSSATVRNDMAELASLGLLEQTHTSSGRVPTELGYRVYLDNLMKMTPVTKQEQTAINDILYACADVPEHLLEKAAELLSHLTNCAAIAASPSGEEAVIRRISFVQTGRYTAMAVLITSTGSVKTKLFRCDFMITPDLLAMFDKVVSEKMTGLPVTGVTPAFMQTMAVSLGEMSMLMPNVLLAIHDAAKEAASTNVAIKGQSNLFVMPELASADGKKVMELMGHSSELSKLLKTAGSKASVLIGSEIRNPALASLSVIVTHYTASSECTGALALIGPVRMNYPKIISMLEYVTEIVGTLLGELLDSNSTVQ